jgi:hypothetical protein
MTVEHARHVLLWCTVINFAFVLVWSLLLVLPHEWLYRCWSRWSRLTAEQFDGINFAGIVLYESGILLFNLAPYIALCIVR